MVVVSRQKEKETEEEDRGKRGKEGGEDRGTDFLHKDRKNHKGQEEKKKKEVANRRREHAVLALFYGSLSFDRERKKKRKKNKDLLPLFPSLGLPPALLIMSMPDCCCLSHSSVYALVRSSGRKKKNLRLSFLRLRSSPFFL